MHFIRTRIITALLFVIVILAALIPQQCGIFEPEEEEPYLFIPCIVGLSASPRAVAPGEPAVLSIMTEKGYCVEYRLVARVGHFDVIERGPYGYPSWVWVAPEDTTGVFEVEMWINYYDDKWIIDEMITLRIGVNPERHFDNMTMSGIKVVGGEIPKENYVRNNGRSGMNPDWLSPDEYPPVYNVCCDGIGRAKMAAPAGSTR